MDYDLPPLFGAIVSRKLATLHELKTVYTYKECLQLYDVAATDSYNQKMVNKNIEDRQQNAPNR